MDKEFDKWNDVKKNLNEIENKVYFKERDIFWASIGKNIGFEQNGKSELYSRPVLIMKKFSRNMFFGIPLSTQLKQGSFFFEFELNGSKSNALLVQGRLYDSKRLEMKIGTISKEEFGNLKIKLRKLLDI